MRYQYTPQEITVVTSASLHYTKTEDIVFLPAPIVAEE